MSLVHARIGVKAGVNHDPVDKVVDNGGNAIHTAETVVKRLALSGRHDLFLSIAGAAGRTKLDAHFTFSSTLFISVAEKDRNVCVLTVSLELNESIAAVAVSSSGASKRMRPS